MVACRSEPDVLTRRYRYTRLLLARLMGQYCFAGWRCRRLSSVVVCNAAGGRAGSVTVSAAGRVDGRAADTARRASRVTSR